MPTSYDPERHRRRSIRLKEFDYRTPGAYVVTICVQNRISLLGSVIEGRVSCSAAGSMVQSVWDEIPDNYHGVEIDAFVVMPNHVHGIFLLTDNGVIGPEDRLSAPDVVHRFKSLTTHRYGEGVRDQGWPEYDMRLWQRNYFERVIRNERELDKYREYIETNPERWDGDKLNPSYVPVG